MVSLIIRYLNCIGIVHKVSAYNTEL